MIIRKEFEKVVLKGMRTVAVVGEIKGNISTPASVIAEPHVSFLTDLDTRQQKKNVFSDALCHRRDKVSFLISRLGFAHLLSLILML